MMKNLTEFTKKGKYFSSICKDCRKIKRQTQKYKYEPNEELKQQICRNCKEDKDIQYFYKNAHLKNGYDTLCIDCIKIVKKLHNKTDKGKASNKNRLNRFYKNNPIYRKEYQEKYRPIKNEKRKTQEYKDVRNNSRNERYKNDLQYKIINRIRGRLRSFLNENDIIKTNNTDKTIGCDRETFTKWIKFNLRIDNLTEYHLDHLQPLASFNCETFEDVIESKCNHWTNIIPLSPDDNLIKSDRLPTKKELFKQDIRLSIFKLKYLN